jgi:hypothetical protein
MAGVLTVAQLDEKLDINGSSFQEASTAAGHGGASHQVLLTGLCGIISQEAHYTTVATSYSMQTRS